MMSRSPDIIFMAEYIKNVLYFATVREGKVLKSCAEIHYFSIDNELVYENYYSDFGPLNLGCVYKYCKILNDKLKQYLNKQKIVHYTSIDPKKKVNSAFVLGCYGVLYLSLQPKDALKPLLVHGQSYRPFQDATQGDSGFTISLTDCLQAIMKANDLGFFNFQDFNYEEYNRLDKIQGGDLNWIVPGKYLAFIGPVDYSVSLYHPPEMYIDYFLENNVKIVIRLNKRLYDGNVFNNAGIHHYDLFFPDGSCPPRHILMKFLQISEECDGAIAVHCKAGLGRTGSLIGCYLMKHYRMTAHEAIGWMRICRPGSVIGHQQAWLEQLEAWLVKQGDLFRKRAFNDPGKLPHHEFGVYSIAEKTLLQRPVVFQKSPSLAPVSRQLHSENTNALRAQASRYREKEVTNKTKTESYDQWRVRPTRVNSQKVSKGKDNIDATSTIPRRSSGAGEPRPTRSPSRSLARTPNLQKPTAKDSSSRNFTSGVHSGHPLPISSFLSANSTATKDSSSKNLRGAYSPPITTFRTTNGPVIKNVNDARNFLLKSSMYNEERERQLMASMTVTPHSYALSRPINHTSFGQASPPPHVVPSAFSTATRAPVLPQQRRRLGRSPSPQMPQSRMPKEQSRATNTPPPPPPSYSKDKFLITGDSKATLKEALSRLKLTSPRDGSIGTASVGAASLGARRDAPVPKRAPSVRSDERPLATQGDLLNSIKFQRRLRDSLHTDKFHDKLNDPNSRNIARGSQDYSSSRDKQPSVSKNFFSPTRPSSPKGRRSPHSPNFF